MIVASLYFSMLRDIMRCTVTGFTLMSDFFKSYSNLSNSMRIKAYAYLLCVSGKNLVSEQKVEV